MTITIALELTLLAATLCGIVSSVRRFWREAKALDGDLEGIDFEG